MYIKFVYTPELGEIVAGLVKQGLTFEVTPVGDYWVIELTGGF